MIFSLLTDGVDFVGTRETFQFGRFTNNVPQCACIPILQDSVVEGREFFEVGLSSFDSQVQLALNSTVIIADDDGMWYVSFQMYNILHTLSSVEVKMLTLKGLHIKLSTAYTWYIEAWIA